MTGQAPLIDEASTTIGNSIANRQINSLPTGRSYTSVAQISTGVSTQTTNTANFANTMVINGSTGLENGFVIDGVVTNGVEYGAQGKDLNYEFIQELEVKTGGYQAEYGRSTGGIINVITKSGGNDFHGDAFVYYDNDSLQADNKHPEDSNLFSFTSGYNRLDYGFDLGGYVMKDRLWFFGAYDRVENTIKRTVTDGPETGRPANTDTNRNLGSAKLTWMIGGSHTLVGSYFQDPRTDDGSPSRRHPQRERPLPDVHRRAGPRRQRLFPALHRPLRLELVVDGPGRPAPREEQRQSGDRPAGTRSSTSIRSTTSSRADSA